VVKKEMTVFILNSLITPINFDKVQTARVRFERIDVERAKNILSNGNFVSAIGHEGTAKVLSQLLGINIPTNRVSIFMETGDVAIHFFLKTRLPEGKILSEDEVKKLDFWLVKSEVL
jgi:hypothetical protein